MKNKFLYIFFLSIAISGCATNPTPLATARNVTPDRVFIAAPKSSSSLAKAVFVRDKGFLGSGVYQHIYINGAKAASVDTGEKIEIDLEPGEYIFGVRPTDAFGTTALYSIDQTLLADKIYHYRILIDGNSFMSRLQRYIPNQSNQQ